MTILIGADICVTKSNANFFADADIDGLIGKDLKEKLAGVDFRIFNLEGPLTDSGTPIEKCGLNIKMPVSAIDGIKALSPSLLTLANNHIIDYGKEGYADTVSLLNKNQIDYVGTGENIETIKKTHILEKDGVRVGVYACAEHEFTIAEKGFPGANPYDPLVTFDDISALKRQCDYVIVLYHGGKECYRYPSPELQRCFRKMTDKGADFVVAQHTHCIGCEEKHYGATLVYGQGNFIFDDDDNEFWNSGMLAEIEIKHKDVVIQYVPYKKVGGIIRLCDSEEKAALLKAFYSRTEEIKDAEFVQDNFHTFAKELFPDYLSVFHGDNFLFKVFRKIFGRNIVMKLYTKSLAYNRIRNFIECECHREVVLDVLKND